MSELCSKTLFGRGRAFRGTPCENRGKVLVDGRWYCTLHSPGSVAKRKAAREERWAVRQEINNRRLDREAAGRLILSAASKLVRQEISFDDFAALVAKYEALK